jgi:tetratricopeptide (TPR) repeat protein
MMEGAPETLVVEGYQARRDGRLEDAKRSFAAAIDLCRPAGSSALLVRALTGLGQIERDTGNLHEALRLYLEAVALCRTLGDPFRLAHTIRHQGDILRNQEEFELAEPCYIEALAIYRSHEQSSAGDVANALRGFALVKTATGANEEARQLWLEARELYAQAGVEAGVLECETQMARLTR